MTYEGSVKELALEKEGVGIITFTGEDVCDAFLNGEDVGGTFTPDGSELALIFPPEAMLEIAMSSTSEEALDAIIRRKYSY